MKVKILALTGIILSRVGIVPGGNLAKASSFWRKRPCEGTRAFSVQISSLNSRHQGFQNRHLQCH